MAELTVKYCENNDSRTVCHGGFGKKGSVIMFGASNLLLLSMGQEGRCTQNEPLRRKMSLPDFHIKGIIKSVKFLRKSRSDAFTS